jgi:hypothetical protein
MDDNVAQKIPNSGNRTIVILILLAIVAIALIWHFTRKPSSEAPQHQSSAVVKAPITPETVVDYDQVKTDPQKKADMASRKEEFGFEKGVDIIVRSGDTVKVGETTVPMREILDKIRLKKGEIVEKDISGSSESAYAEKVSQRLHDEISKLHEQQSRLDAELEQAQKTNDAEAIDKIKQEQSAISETLELYDRYRETVADLEATQEKGAVSGDELTAIKLKKAKMETVLFKRLGIEDLIDAYGIYIVRKNDSIWNIHFQFLKEYFQHRSIALSPRSDEPDQRGFSSGVGKILKFSENMVHIYNLREKKLDTDLNLIQPESKIIIFNLSQVFSLLQQIDLTNVQQIQFDGETLWFPAE